MPEDKFEKNIEKRLDKIENIVDKTAKQSNIQKKEIALEKKTQTHVESKINTLEAKVDKMQVDKLDSKWVHGLNKNVKEILTEEQKNALLEDAKISLWIDSYNELFSDFDPRSYSKREISADFLAEAKRFARDQFDGADLVILVPSKLRDKNIEGIIKKRLKQSFLKQHEFLVNKKKKIILQGITFLLLGVFFMVFTTFILFSYDVKDFLIYFLGVIGEPAGWFLFWEGLNLIIFDSKERNSDLEFNKKMSKINIIFNDYN
jgi:translation elongation factor EF-Ts